MKDYKTIIEVENEPLVQANNVETSYPGFKSKKILAFVGVAVFGAAFFSVGARAGFKEAMSIKPTLAMEPPLTEAGCVASGSYCGFGSISGGDISNCYKCCSGRDWSAWTFKKTGQFSNAYYCK